MIKIKNLDKTLKDLNKKIADKIESDKQKKSLQIIEALKDATPVDTGEARDGWKFENSQIINEVEHIKYLNEGSSTKAPTFFVEKTILSQEGVVPSGTIVVTK